MMMIVPEDQGVLIRWIVSRVYILQNYSLPLQLPQILHSQLQFGFGFGFEWELNSVVLIEEKSVAVV